MLLWLAHWIERHPGTHRISLRIWRLFPPRLAGFLKGRSPEIEDARLVPLPELAHYDVFSADARLLQDDLPRLRSKLAVPRSDRQPEQVKQSRPVAK